MQDLSYPQLASRLVGRPLLLHPDKAELILQVLSGRMAFPNVEASNANRFVGEARSHSGQQTSFRVQDSVAILPIVGSLVNRGAWIGAQSGLVSYEGIIAQVKEAEVNPDIKAVILDIDSPGGEASGMFSAADAIAKLDQVKPVVALVNDVAASAAYGLASAAREILISPTSLLGSIGVVLTHFDRSGEMAQQGIKPTLIYAGARKVDGHPFAGLGDEVRGDLQREVEAVYDQFVSLVAKGRAGRMTAEEIRATEARSYMGGDAIAQGLADRMASLDEIIDHYANLQRSAPAMSRATPDTAPLAEASTQTRPQNPQYDKAIADAARAEGLQEGLAAGQSQATARIKAILTSPEAEGRSAQALVLALETAMSASEAEKVLAASAKEAVAASIAERAQGQGELGSDDHAASHQDRQAAVAASWNAAIEQANARFS